MKVEENNKNLTFMVIKKVDFYGAVFIKTPRLGTVEKIRLHRGENAAIKIVFVVYLIGQNNVGQNFRQKRKTSSLLSDEKFCPTKNFLFFEFSFFRLRSDGHIYRVKENVISLGTKY